jgi:hypothetical protein
MQRAFRIERASFFATARADISAVIVAVQVFKRIFVKEMKLLRSSGHGGERFITEKVFFNKIF